MKYRIRHSTTYTYTAPVFLEPHVVRLCPRTDPGQRLHRFDLEMSPSPAGMSHGIQDHDSYTARISAVNFSVHTDDGLHPEAYAQAELILMANARVGLHEQTRLQPQIEAALPPGTRCLDEGVLDRLATAVQIDVG